MEKEQILEKLHEMLSASQIETDIKELQNVSVDRFRKFEAAFEVWTQPIPVAIVKPKDSREVSKLLAFFNENKINVVPRSGGSATEGGLETAVKNTVVLDSELMNKIIKIDTYDMQVTVQSGVVLEEIEEKLRSMGYTTGHSPQSKPIAKMGGLVATRSIGQFSTLYGGIEDMVIGLEAVFPDGQIARIRNIPRRAAGPDIRHVIIGNEGALCVITEVTVKIFKYMPENNRFFSYALNEMKTGFEILREVMVQGYKPSIARLYDYSDASQHSHLEELLSKGENILIFMTEGAPEISKSTGNAIEEIISKYPECRKINTELIENWFSQLNWDKERIDKDYEHIRETGIVKHTTEVSGTWSCIYTIYKNCIERVKKEHPHYEDFLRWGGHSSHSYINGTNMYFIYHYKTKNITPDEEVFKYHNVILDIICEETIKLGGSMVHHHGCGKARARFSRDEHGSSYFILEKMKEVFDPNKIMNSGCIFPLEKHKR